MRSNVIVGTRGSKLALAQARIAAERLRRAYPEIEVTLQPIVTAGDRNQRASLAEIGGKGVFIREIERALCGGSIDIAVHSFKDITSRIPETLELCAFLAPESVCDTLVSRDGSPLAALPPGAIIGSGSMRRRALLSRMRPDLRFADIRGNVETRIAKMERGDCDAVALSEAGLMRLGLAERAAQRFDPSSFYPAPGQGVIALEIRRRDRDLRDLCRRAADADQLTVSLAELSLLAVLGFDCRTPLGVYTRLKGPDLAMAGFQVRPESGEFVERRALFPAHNPGEAGASMARLLTKGGTNP